MRHADSGAVHNTTISAVVVLERLHLDRLKVRKATRSRAVELGRALTKDEIYTLVTEQEEECVPRVVVYTNPYGRMPMPEDVFRGHFDEHWAYLDEVITRTFCGPGIEDLERP